MKPLALLLLAFIVAWLLRRDRWHWEPEIEPEPEYEAWGV